MLTAEQRVVRLRQLEAHHQRLDPAEDEEHERRRDVAREVIPGERRRPTGVRRGLAEGRLLDGEERTDLIAGRADDPDRRGEDQQRDPARHREQRPGADHQEGARDQDAAPPDPVGARRQPQRDHRVPDQRESQDRANGQRIQAEGREIQDEDDGQKAVAEHAQDSGREQEPPVTIEAAQAGHESGIERGVHGGRAHRRSLRARM